MPHHASYLPFTFCGAPSEGEKNYREEEGEQAGQPERTLYICAWWWQWPCLLTGMWVHASACSYPNDGAVDLGRHERRAAHDKHLFIVRSITSVGRQTGMALSTGDAKTRRRHFSVLAWRGNACA